MNLNKIKIVCISEKYFTFLELLKADLKALHKEKSRSGLHGNVV